MKRKIVNEVTTALPLFDNIFVFPDPVKTQTDGGILIPETAQEEANIGYVVAVGIGKKDEPMYLKVGDRVAFSKYAGTELKWEGQEYKIMRETDIKALLNDKNPQLIFVPYTPAAVADGLDLLTDIDALEAQRVNEEALGDQKYATGVKGGEIVPIGRGWARKLNNKPLPGVFDTSAAAISAFKVSEEVVLAAQKIANTDNGSYITLFILEAAKDSLLTVNDGSVIIEEAGEIPENKPTEQEQKPLLGRRAVGVTGYNGPPGTHVPPQGKPFDSFKDLIQGDKAQVADELLYSNDSWQLNKLNTQGGRIELYSLVHHRSHSYYESEALARMAMSLNPYVHDYVITQVGPNNTATEADFVNYMDQYHSRWSRSKKK